MGGYGSEKTNLRVSDEHNLGLRAPLDKRLDGSGGILGTLRRRLLVRDAAALALATTGRVVEGLGGGAGVRLHDGLDDGAGCAHASRSGGLAGAEDVEGRAGLARDVDGRGAGREEEGGG